MCGSARNARKSTHQNRGPSLSSALEIARIRIGKRKKRRNELLPSLNGLVLVAIRSFLEAPE
jgi:hypothetical protein